MEDSSESDHSLLEDETGEQRLIREITAGVGGTAAGTALARRRSPGARATRKQLERARSRPTMPRSIRLTSESTDSPQKTLRFLHRRSVPRHVEPDKEWQTWTRGR